jgi:hypothetical protein
MERLKPGDSVGAASNLWRGRRRRYHPGALCLERSGTVAHNLILLVVVFVVAIRRVPSPESRRCLLPLLLSSLIRTIRNFPGRSILLVLVAG